MGNIFSIFNVSDCTNEEDLENEDLESKDYESDNNDESDEKQALSDSSDQDANPYDSDDCTIIHSDKESVLPFDLQRVAQAQLPLDEICFEINERMNFRYAAIRNSVSFASMQTDESTTAQSAHTSTQDAMRPRNKP